MSGTFNSLFRQHREALIFAWVDEIYADRRTDLPTLLSYRELIEHLPDVLTELAGALDGAAQADEISLIVRRLSPHAQVRFRQGCLIDEVARELMTLRDVIIEFLWREGMSVADGDFWELRDALWRTDKFIDELIAQTLVIYAASLRPPVRTRTSRWPPPLRRLTDFPERFRQQ